MNTSIMRVSRFIPVALALLLTVARAGSAEPMGAGPGSGGSLGSAPFPTVPPPGAAGSLGSSPLPTVPPLGAGTDTAAEHTRLLKELLQKVAELERKLPLLNSPPPSSPIGKSGTPFPGPAGRAQGGSQGGSLGGSPGGSLGSPGATAPASSEFAKPSKTKLATAGFADVSVFQYWLEAKHTGCAGVMIENTGNTCTAMTPMDCVSGDRATKTGKVELIVGNRGETKATLDFSPHRNPLIALLKGEGPFCKTNPKAIAPCGPEAAKQGESVEALDFKSGRLETITVEGSKNPILSGSGPAGNENAGTAGFRKSADGTRCVAVLKLGTYPDKKVALANTAAAEGTQGPPPDGTKGSPPLARAKVPSPGGRPHAEVPDKGGSDSAHDE